MPDSKADPGLNSKAGLISDQTVPIFTDCALATVWKLQGEPGEKGKGSGC